MVSTHTATAANSRKNRSHLIPTLIPTLLIKEGRAARGSRIRDPDQRRSLPHSGAKHTCCVRANFYKCTMHLVWCCYTQACYWQRATDGLLRNKGKKETTRAKAVIAPGSNEAARIPTTQ